MIRHFEIRSPRADFTGKIADHQFVDGVARCSFDDTRHENGAVISDTVNGVDPGRSLLLFAQRRADYTAIETDEHGAPLAPGASTKSPAKRGKAA